MTSSGDQFLPRPGVPPRRDDDEPTQVIPSGSPHTGGASRVPEADRTRVDAASGAWGRTDPDRTRTDLPPLAPASRRPLDDRPEDRGRPVGRGAAVPGGATDVRGTTDWQLAMSRMNNRPMTDLGLLVLRLCSLPLVLHGLHHASDFGGFVGLLRSHWFTQAAPEVFAVLVIAGQIVLPALLALGLFTRFSGLAQAALMACVYGLWVLGTDPVVDPRTGALSGEAALGYAAIALPLFFTGAGRFSLDHAFGAGRRARRADRRVERSLGR